MDYTENNEIPGSILTSLEDMTTELLDLQELILAVAATADSLPATPRREHSGSVH